jgi:hypothetical protein
MTPAEIEAAAPDDERRVLASLWNARFSSVGQAELWDRIAGVDCCVSRETHEKWKPFIRYIYAEAYLDAAMMLVPDGAHQIVGGVRFSVECWAERGSCVHPPHVRATAWVPGAERTYAATPALALCAAIAKGIE